MFKRLGLALIATVITGFAMAGIWNNSYSIVGGAAYCSSTVNAICVNTVAAGPTAVTGNETIPADTNIGASGVQSVKIPIASLGGGVQNAAPLTATSITITQGISKLILNPAGTIATLTVVFPASTLLYDGQLLTLVSSQTVTTLTITAGSGTTVNGTNTTLTAAAPLPGSISDSAAFRQAHGTGV